MQLKWPLVILLLVLMGSCREEVLPKPKAMLRLEYPNSPAGKLETDHFEFELNALANVKDRNAKSLTLEYPKMKGSIFITYKKVEGDLQKLLSDAQKLSYEHVVKADAIDPKEFINESERVYGMFYEVKGDAASQAQFYATDSLTHFVTGSLYFYVKPNYDSIYPAAVYLQNDIQRIMETLKWKN
ncbi:gliding motility lipoprotein GldD [Muriicola sp. Z0-33]|uniref:gliding motility lipoprotein GldD n=1 Tax=Muriicola sp. Z0-33 TaxID=2816957 RepID=UPI002238FCA7|nr:gliding motility lipoprotein GldD [Muriicola sp. Z0-33]MCW5514970.1 gliding motility lipoprotein GldD [Muriicola sp. Z0-33]